MEHIIEILVWPVTIIIIVMILRSPISALVPTLKKLKYKDLELEFEREANKLLSEAERDLPEVLEDKNERKRKRTTDVLFSISRPEPATEVLEAWRKLELNIRDLAKAHNVQGGKSTRSLVEALMSNALISKEASTLILNLAAFRNKVAHTNEEIISYEVSSAFAATVERVISALRNT